MVTPFISLIVQLLFIAYGKLQSTRYDSRLLVVAGRITSKLQHLRGEALHHRSEVDGATGTHSLGVIALTQEPVDSACAPGPALTLGSGFAALSSSGPSSSKQFDWRWGAFDRGVAIVSE